MSGALMNTKEVAQYLDIHEKQVYLLIKAGKIPCSRVTGKWIFPKDLIDEWIRASAQGAYRHARQRLHHLDGALLASGSNDPALDILLSVIKKNHPEFILFSANTGSVDGLTKLNMGLTDIAFSHLFDPETGDYNTPYLQRHCPDLQPVVVNLFYREIGFLVAKSRSGFFKGWESLASPRIRFVNRQRGAGIRLLLDNELMNRGISPKAISGYDHEVYTHLEVGLSLVSGEADVGIASATVSKIFDLKFLPLVSERFDMVLDKHTFFHPAIQTFIETIGSTSFKSRVKKIGNYNFKDAGRILYSSA